MNISVHYLTLDPSRIIKQITNREKRAIEDYYTDIEIYEWQRRRSTELQPNWPTIDEALEQVVVKTWEDVLSVYPIVVTPYQEDNETWVKCDTRSKSFAQKHGCIFIGIKETTFHFEFWKHGDNLIYEDIPIDLSSMSIEELTLQRSVPMDILQKIQFDTPEKLGSPMFDIPLALPTMWEEKWTVYKKTQFTSFCM